MIPHLANRQGCLNLGYLGGEAEEEESWARGRINSDNLGSLLELDFNYSLVLFILFCPKSEILRSLLEASGYLS